MLFKKTFVNGGGGIEQVHACKNQLVNVNKNKAMKTK